MPPVTVTAGDAHPAGRPRAALRREGLLGLIAAFAVAISLPFALLYLLHPSLDGDALVLERGSFVARAETDSWTPPDDAEPVNLPHDWRGRMAGLTGGTYYFALDLAVPPDRLWAVYLPSVSMNAAVFLNGEIIGHGGSQSAPLARHWARPMYFLVPNGLLRAGGNMLAIRVMSEPEGAGFLDAPHIGAHEILRGAFEQRHAMTHTAHLAIMMLLACVGALMLMLWAARRRESVYLWFALACLAWCVHMLNLVVVEPPMPARAWECLWLVSLVWLAVFAARFVVAFLDPASADPARVLVPVGLAASLVLVLFALGRPGEFDRWAAPATGVLSVSVGIAPGFLLLRRLAQAPAPDVTLMVLAGTTLFVLAMHDAMIVGNWVHRANGLLTAYAAPIVLASFGRVLVRRFVAALATAESLNAELEARVAARERELAHHHVRLRELAREQAIALERERLMRDMHDGLGGTILAALNMSQRPQVDRACVTSALRQALQDLRLMIDSLDPLDGDVTALMGMFRARVQPHLAAVGIEAHWRLDDLPPCGSLTPDRALQILRIAQEAVNNTVKHARARNLYVSLTSAHEADGRLVGRLCLHDDGQGFDPVRAAPGRGLTNMQRRAQGCGLGWALSSTQQGTAVTLTLELA